MDIDAMLEATKLDIDAMLADTKLDIDAIVASFKFDIDAILEPQEAIAMAEPTPEELAGIYGVSAEAIRQAQAAQAAEQATGPEAVLLRLIAEAEQFGVDAEAYTKAHPDYLALYE